MSTERNEQTIRRVALGVGAELLVRVKRGELVVFIEGDGELELVQRGGEVLGHEPVRRTRELGLERALAAVRADPARRFTVRQLAKLAGASQSTFLRRFVRSMGTAPHVWLAALRLEFARTLVIETDRGLAEIASQTGYSSAFGLSRAFKRHFGVAPSVLRRTTTEAPAAARCAA